MIDLNELLKEPHVSKIASACGISEVAVYKWRRKGRIPSDRLRVVADVTGTSLELLVEHFIPARVPA